MTKLEAAEHLARVAEKVTARWLAQGDLRPQDGHLLHDLMMAHEAYNYVQLNMTERARLSRRSTVSAADELWARATEVVESAIRSGFTNAEEAGLYARWPSALTALSMMIQSRLRVGVQEGTLAMCSNPGFAVADDARLTIRVRFMPLEFFDERECAVTFQLSEADATLARDDIARDGR
jgi:hypothetical protein